MNYYFRQLMKKFVKQLIDIVLNLTFDTQNQFLVKRSSLRYKLSLLVNNLNLRNKRNKQPVFQKKR